MANLLYVGPHFTHFTQDTWEGWGRYFLDDTDS